VRKHKVTVFQYVGEICRYLTNTPEQPNEDRNTLKAIWGSGMGIDVWTKFVRRFGSHIRIFEGWGATESNGNMMNFDNRAGSCGRIPYPERTHVRLVRYDPETESHPRDANGHLILCKPEDVGEVICQIARADGTPVAPFEGYTSAEETRKKILEDVFEHGDIWWRSGDLLRRDADDYFYFVDRIGDTFRWKAENVSTTEVTQQLSTAYFDAEIINVYGVHVPNHEGQGGMAAIVMKQDRNFDPVAFYRVAVSILPHYAVPLFLRICESADMTGTFKMRKVDLRMQAFNRSLVRDPLFALSHQQERYIPLDDDALSAMGISVL
jgi:fatty-acyl-CoA synthase